MDMNLRNLNKGRTLKPIEKVGLCLLALTVIILWFMSGNYLTAIVTTFISIHLFLPLILKKK